MITEESRSAIQTDWLSAPPESALAAGFRLLCAGPEEPDWIGLALQLDAIGCHDPKFRWISTPSETMTVLRNETFDCVIVTCGPRSERHNWDGPGLIQAIRAAGCSDPIVLLTEEASDATTLEACRHHCELLTSPSLWSSRVLITIVQRAISQAETVRQNHHLEVANHRRLVRERDEADHLLKQQRDIIIALESIAQGDSSETASESVSTGFEDPNWSTTSYSPKVAPEADPGSSSRPESTAATSDCRAGRPIQVPNEIKSYYHELLRTYVIMGSGSLGTEIAQLAHLLAEVGLSPRDTLSLHLERVEGLVRGLGNRSTRHVMARADLLALELIIHLGECYQHSAQ